MKYEKGSASVDLLKLPATVLVNRLFSVHLIKRPIQAKFPEMQNSGRQSNRTPLPAISYSISHRNGTL